MTMKILLLIVLLLYRWDVLARQYGNAIFPGYHGTILPGKSSTFVGDTNGDGIADMIVFLSRLECILFFGSKSRIEEFNDHFTHLQNLTGKGYFIHGNSLTVSKPAGDFNNDGFDDYFIQDILDRKQTMFLLFGKRDTQAIDLLEPLGNKGIAFMSNVPFHGDFLGAYSIGDVNKDRIDDIMILESGFIRENNTAYVFYGGSLQSSTTIILDRSISDRNKGYYVTNCNTQQFQSRASSIGDFNGDGVADFVLSPLASNTFTIIFGGVKSNQFSILASNLSFTQTFRIHSPVISQISHLSSAGDINGDGLADLLVVSPRWALFIVGSPNYPDVNIDIDYLTDRNDSRFFFIDSEYTKSFDGGMYYGDFNLDGYDDNLLLSFSGVLYLFYGRKDFTTRTDRFIDLDTLESNGLMITIDGRGGHSLSSGMDFDGDGMNDIIVVDSLQFHSLFISSRKLKEHPLHRRISSKYAQRVETAHLITGIGDFNGDGTDDILISLHSPYKNQTENLFIFFGKSQELLGGNRNVVEADLIIHDLEPADYLLTQAALQYHVYPVSDMNRDGFDDFFVSCHYNGKLFGKIVLLYGRAVDPTDPSSRIIRLNSLRAEDGVTFYSSEWTEHIYIHSIGDFNGDTIADILFLDTHRDIIGSRGTIMFGRTSFPSTSIDLERQLQPKGPWLFSIPSRTAGVGDVNDDGFDDFLLMNSTVVMIVFGNPAIKSGVIAPEVVFEIQSENIDSLSILSIWAAGDVNGDGFSDFGVSVSDYVDSWRCYLFLGEKNIQKFRKFTFLAPRARMAGDIVITMDINKDGFSDFVLSLEGNWVLYLGRRNISSLADIEYEGLTISGIYSEDAHCLGDFDNDTIIDISIGDYIFPGKLLSDLPPLNATTQKSSLRISFSPIPSFPLQSNLSFTGWYILGIIFVLLLLSFHRYRTFLSLKR